MTAQLTNPAPQAPAVIPEHPDQPDFLESRNRAIRALVNAERVLAAGFLALVFFLVLSQVASRYIFASPLTWTEELARFALVWLTFISAGFVMARRLHVTVDLLAAKLGKRAALVMDSFAMLVVLAVSGAMAYAGMEFALAAARLKAPATQLPMSWVYTAAAVGFGLIFIHGLLNTYVNLKHPAQVPGAMDNLEKEAF
ncbi:TRAP transporter small permease [Pseudarthrobacter sp. NPDC058362]|uniref:TRAP transporter small permease n=1 Tax=unclassified Pseudarthrobacter TaxID=2647000 RepID=UPI00365FBC57